MTTLFSDDFTGVTNGASIGGRAVNNAAGGLGNRQWFTSGPPLIGNASGALSGGANPAANVYVEIGVPLVGFARARFDPAAATSNVMIGIFAAAPFADGVALVLAGGHTSLRVRTFVGGTTNDVATVAMTAPAAPFWIEIAVNSARTGITAIIRNDNLTIRNQVSATLGSALVGDIACFGFYQGGTEGLFDNFSVDHATDPFFDDGRGAADTALTARGWAASSPGVGPGLVLNGSGGIKSFLASTDYKRLTRDIASSNHFIEVVIGADYSTAAASQQEISVLSEGTASRSIGHQLRYNVAESLWELHKDSQNRMTSVAGTRAAGDRIRLEAVGGVLTGYKNGVQIITSPADVGNLARTNVGLRTAGDASTNYADVFRSVLTGPIVGPDTTAPTITGTLTVSSIATTTATLAWPAGADNVAVTSYERQLNAGAWVDVGNVLTVGLTGLSPSTGYTVRVRSKDGAGNVAATPIEATFTTLDVQPGDPSAVTVTVSGGTTATIAWTAGSPAAGTHAVEVETPSGAGNWTAPAGVLTGVSFAATGLLPATEYRARVRATNGALNSAWVVDDVSFTTDNTGTGGGVIPAATPKIETEEFRDWSGVLLASATIPHVVILRASDAVVMLTLADQVTAVDGTLTIEDNALVVGATYLVAAFSSDGASRGLKAYQAV